MSGYWEISNLKTPKQYLDFAKACLDSAYLLCQQIVVGEFEETFSRGSVILSLTHHSVELFLKAFISTKQSRIKKSHDIRELESIFRKLYPGLESEISIPFKTGYLGFTKEEILEEIKIENKKFPKDQMYRYPVDKDGNIWPGGHSFNAYGFFKKLERIKDDFAKLEKLIFNQTTK